MCGFYQITVLRHGAFNPFGKITSEVFRWSSTKARSAPHGQCRRIAATPGVLTSVTNLRQAGFGQRKIIGIIPSVPLLLPAYAVPVLRSKVA